MRSSLIGGLISTVAYNLHHKQPRVRVFEVGRCFIAEQNQGDYQQPWRIGAAACGDAVPEQWGARPSRPVDFYDVKADLEALFQPSALTFVADAHPALHPGTSAGRQSPARVLRWRSRSRGTRTTAPVSIFNLERHGEYAV